MTLQIAQAEIEKLKRQNASEAATIADLQARKTVRDTQIAALEKFVADQTPAPVSAAAPTK
jgi:hypothetical protein